MPDVIGEDVFADLDYALTNRITRAFVKNRAGEFRCPRCGAQPFYRCRTRKVAGVSFAKSEPHDERVVLAILKYGDP